jgi:hypothetical protein
MKTATAIRASRIKAEVFGLGPPGFDINFVNLA